VHFVAPPVRSPRDANRGDQRLLRLLHLGLLTTGIFAPSRQMYVLSTAMTPDVLRTMAQRFEAVITNLAATRTAATASA
jgi:glutamate-1-semialdehyde aminotransferase